MLSSGGEVEEGADDTERCLCYRVHALVYIDIHLDSSITNYMRTPKRLTEKPQKMWHTPENTTELPLPPTAQFVTVSVLVQTSY